MLIDRIERNIIAKDSSVRHCSKDCDFFEVRKKTVGFVQVKHAKCILFDLVLSEETDGKGGTVYRRSVKCLRRYGTTGD
ncbi:MAG TPA: hypothetical protein VKO61_01455 [Candidatus Paceibacterota bacterium]|nr:hypothetical protein [Candidatus Paceibacterota bacterium]